MNHMKKNVYVDIHIMSFWHVGSGMGRGADVDALVLKDSHDLPYLPGRTLKGLLREGALLCEEAGILPSGRTFELFGTPSEQGNPAGSKPGCLRFDDARLPQEERLWLASPEGKEYVEALYTSFASTSIDERGMALDKTLRTMELALPLKLEGVVRGSGEENGWIDDLKKACVMVRGLGSHRNRGLGRCKCVLRQEGEHRD